MQDFPWSLRWEKKEAQETAAFCDRDAVWLVGQCPSAARACVERVDFVVQAQNARGWWTPWRTMACLGDVPLDAATGCATIRWSLADVSPGALERWAFATFRFTIRSHATRGSTRNWSPPLRHHTSVIGFYGFGPTGERFANAELRRVAQATGGVVLRRRAAAALRRLAAQVPAGSTLRVFGYSLGGSAAVRFARELARGVEVARLVLIDPVMLSGRPLVVPANVRRAVSYYQRNGGRWFFLIGRAGRGVPVVAESATETEVVNIQRARHPDGEPVMHEDVPRLVAKILCDELQEIAVTASAT